MGSLKKEIATQWDLSFIMCEMGGTYMGQGDLSSFSNHHKLDLPLKNVSSYDSLEESTRGITIIAQMT